MTTLFSWTTRYLSQDETELEDAKRVNDAASDHRCERVIHAGWNHTLSAAEEPLGVARTIPWHAFSANHQQQHQQQANSASSIVSWIPQLLRQPLDDVVVTASPMYATCYVDRLLPGVVERLPPEDKCINATVWKDSENNVPYKERARDHPGDRSGDDAKICTVTTKAGSRLWSISFAASDTDCNDIKASFPGQLLVRFDKGGNMMMYDCFEFIPKTYLAFDNEREAGMDICTDLELLEVEKLLKQSNKKRRRSSEMYSWLDDDEHQVDYENELLPQDRPFSERWRHIPKLKLYYLLNWIRFKKSRLLRIRFPIDAIMGARLVITRQHERPNADAPHPTGMYPGFPLACLGLEPSDFYESDAFDEEAYKAKIGTSFELCDEHIEQLGILVLEFDEPGEKFASNHPFASTVLWPDNGQDRERIPMETDWTPNMSFSRSKRHYIVGDASEIQELSEYLAQTCPKLRALLCPENFATSNVNNNNNNNCHLTKEDLVVAAECFNPLSGTHDILHPCNTNSSDCMMSSLRNLCAKHLLQTSRLIIPINAPTRQFETADHVHSFLQRCGVDEPEKVNPCLKAALLNGHLKVEPELFHAQDASAYLETVLHSQDCGSMFCQNTRICKVQDVLYQTVLGSESESRIERTAPIKCNGFGCSDCYLTGLCVGQPKLATYNHNHCTKCPGFGTCIGYYRSKHCDGCGWHYTPGHDSCDCRRRKMTEAPPPPKVDVRPVSELCWKGEFVGCTLQDCKDAFLRKQYIDTIQRGILKHFMHIVIHRRRLQQIGNPEEDVEEMEEQLDERLKWCFPASFKGKIHHRMDLTQFNLQSLNLIQTVVRGMLDF